MWRNAELEKPDYPNEVLCYVESKNFYTGECSYYYMVGGYIPRFTVDCNGWEYVDCDYLEEEDTFYYPEGWVEKVHNWEDYGFIYMVPSDTVLYWKPLYNSGTREVVEYGSNQSHLY